MFDLDEEESGVKTASLFEKLEQDDGPTWDDSVPTSAMSEEPPQFDDSPMVHKSSFTREFDDSTFVGQPVRTSTPAPKRKRGFFGLFGGR